MITIIDYGVGNLGSIFNMLKKIGIKSKITSKSTEIENATKLILPGVGAFDTCVRNLRASGLIPLISDKVLHRHTPVLGVCVGMQLLCQGSEEGGLPGLGWIKGEVIRWRFDSSVTSQRIPHMGWNTVTFRPTSKLFSGFEGETRFYFVHSYHVICHLAEDVAATVHYGYAATAAIEHGHIYGTQFHPEKSHKFGMRLYKNFAELG
jgi:glutamine amidotransferase